MQNDKLDRIQSTIIMVRKLPVELKRYIFEEFFKSTEFCEMFLQELHSKESMRLEYEPLRKYFKQITVNPYVIDYLNTRCVDFKLSYQTHFIENKKKFRLMNFTDSFMVTILMSMYH